MNKLNPEMRKIPSTLFLYEISEDGRIVRNIKSKKQIQQKIDDQGYYWITLKYKGETYKKSIDSLVAECWLGPIPNKHKIEHIDKNPSNNHYKNLKYITESENRTTSPQKPVKIIGRGEEKTFKSKSDCCAYLCEIYNKPYSTIKNKLTKNKKHIYDYDIIYLRTVET